MSMDIDPTISNWILEFLLSQPLEDWMVDSLLRSLPPPVDNSNVQKLLLLKELESQVSSHSISESTLILLEQLEEIEFQKGSENASDAMRRAYCAVAVECTVKALVTKDTIGDKTSRFNYFAAVKRVWKGRFERMEERVGKGGLVSEELWLWKDEVEAAVWDYDVLHRVVKKSDEVNVVEAVDGYLREERGKLGTSFLELVASRVKDDEFMQGILQLGSIGGVADVEEPLHNVDFMEDVRTVNIEVNRLHKALKSSLLELHVVLKDPLPEALRFAEAIFNKEGEKQFDEEENFIDANIAEGARDDCVVAFGATRENRHHDAVEDNGVEAHSVDGAQVDASREEVRHHDSVLENCVAANTVIGVEVDQATGCDVQNVPRSGLMKRNASGCTYEWDDLIDGLKGDTADSQGRLYSPLKKRNKNINFKGRRKVKKWSLVEEDTLRTAVQKYGTGNWKFILSAYRGVFEDRTAVDLKDKWRNMSR